MIEPPDARVEHGGEADPEQVGNLEQGVAAMLRPKLADPEDEQRQVGEDVDEREARLVQSEEEQGPECVHEQDDEERPAGRAVGPGLRGGPRHEDVERRPDRAEGPVGGIEGRLDEAGIPTLDLGHRGS